MLNYIKSELYKASKQSYMQKLFIFLAIICLCFNLFLFSINKFSGLSINLSEALLNYSDFLLFSFFLPLLVVNGVFSNDYLNKTMKNSLSVGISRKKIFFGKLVSSILITFIFFVNLITIVLLSAILLFSFTHTLILKQLALILESSLKLLPLYTSSVVICVSLFFIFKHNIVVFITYIYCMLLPQTLIDGCSIKFINDIGQNIIKHYHQYFIFIDFNSIINQAQNKQLELLGIHDPAASLISSPLKVLSTSESFYFGIACSFIFILIGWIFYRKREIQ